MQRAPWWRGTRGEWYVVVQFLLLGLVFVTPWLAGEPAWPAPWSVIAWGLGLVLALTGLGLSVAGVLSLGRSLSPLPQPKADTVLVETGLYGLMRHPIYSGLIGGCFGWALLNHSLLALALAVGIFVFFDVKARREERAMAAHFPDYRNYMRRVRRFIPYVY